MKSAACFGLLALIVCCSSVSGRKAPGNPEPLPMVELDESKHAVTVVQSPSGEQQATERAWADRRPPADLDLAPAPSMEPLGEVPASDVAATQGSIVLHKVDDSATVTIPVPNLDVWQPYMGNNDVAVPQDTPNSVKVTLSSSSHSSGLKQLLLKRTFKTAGSTTTEDENVALAPNVLHPTNTPAPITMGTYGGNTGGYGGYGEPGSYGYSGQGHASYKGTVTGKTTVLSLDIPADFNPEDNSLKLSLMGTWVHDSNDYNAAFKLELVDSNNIEVLTYESPVLHHRANRNGDHQQHEAGNAPSVAKFSINYSTVYHNVLVNPGEKVSLKLTTEDGYFQKFGVTIDLDWKHVAGNEFPQSPSPPAVEPSPEVPPTSSPEPTTVEPSPEVPATSSPEPTTVEPSPEVPATSSPEPTTVEPSPEVPPSNSPEPPAAEPSPEVSPTNSPEPPAAEPSPEVPATSSPEPTTVEPSPEVPPTNSPEPPAAEPSPEIPATSSPEPATVEPSPEVPATSSPEPTTVEPSPEVPSTNSPEPPTVEPSPEVPPTNSPEPPAVEPSPEVPPTNSPEPPIVEPSPEVPATSSPEPTTVEPSPEVPTSESPQPAASPSPAPRNPSSPAPPGGKKPNHGKSPKPHNPKQPKPPKKGNKSPTGKHSPSPSPKPSPSPSPKPALKDVKPQIPKTPVKDGTITQPQVDQRGATGNKGPQGPTPKAAPSPSVNHEQSTSGRAVAE